MKVREEWYSLGCLHSFEECGFVALIGRSRAVLPLGAVLLSCRLLKRVFRKHQRPHSLLTQSRLDLLQQSYMISSPSSASRSASSGLGNGEEE